MRVAIRKSKVAGDGLFALENANAREPLLFMTGKRATSKEAAEVCERSGRYDDPFQIGRFKYILLDDAPRAINHSCDPNGGLRGENELFALRDIKKGEELSYDYSTVVGKNEAWESDWWLACSCGATICRKRIGNWESLPKKRLQFYSEHGALPDFVKRQIS